MHHFTSLLGAELLQFCKLFPFGYLTANADLYITLDGHSFVLFCFLIYFLIKYPNTDEFKFVRL